MSWIPYVVGGVLTIAVLWLAKPVLSLMIGPSTQLMADEPPENQRSIHQFVPQAADGSPYPLAQHAGQVLMVVNTASKCGLTPQYEGLQALQQTYGERGFTVLAFPCNDFLGQEPGSMEDIQLFCSMNYGTTFPVLNKISVKGDDKDPLYEYLITESPFPGKIRWNFDKFLVNPAGQVIARFSPRSKPQSEDIVAAIEQHLPSAEEWAKTQAHRAEHGDHGDQAQKLDGSPTSHSSFTPPESLLPQVQP